MEQIQIIKCKLVNCFLLTGENGSILIDTGNPGEGERIIEKIGDKKVKLILVTHGHNDHSGSAEYLREKLSAPIAMGEGDIEILKNPAARALHGHTFLGKTLAKASVANLAATEPLHFEPDIILHDGDDLSQYGVNAKAIALPGHTKGSFGVLTGNGVLFAGDAVFNMLRPTVARHYEDRESMYNSIKKINKSGARIVYVGHGNAVMPEKIK